MAGRVEAARMLADYSLMSEEELIEYIANTIDVLWTLIGACLVFFMQIGFSMLEVGSVHASSTKNVLLKNIFDASISAVTWSLLGHGLAFGPSIDSSGFLPGKSGFAVYAGQATALEYAHWLFHWAFVSTAATIVSGAVAQRIRLEAYLTFAVLLSVLTYPLIVHWVWSDDGMFSAGRGQNSSGAVPLFGCGVLDFAGSGVVHVTGGLSALMAIVMLGPRDGVTFNAQGQKRAPVGQSPTLRTLGTLSLWFGWFGFNGCSVSYLVGQSSVAARAMVMTAISGGVSGLAGTLVAYLQADGRRQIDLSTTLNSILAGLVGITANCATVRLEGAFFIGIMSAVVYVFSVRLLNRYHIDDVVESVPVHLACGLWGIIAAGFFTVPSLYVEAYPRAPDDESDDNLGTRAKACAGVLYGGNGSQLGANLTFLLLQGPWIVVTVGVLFFGLHWHRILRVTDLVEKVGLDEMYHNDRGTREDEDREMEMTQGGAKAVLRGAANVLAGLSGPCIPIEPMSFDEGLAEERRIAERNRAALVEGPGEQRPVPSIDNSLNNEHLPSRLPLIEDSSVSTGNSSSTGILDNSVNSLESFRRQQRAAAEHSERMAELDNSRNLRIVGQLDSSRNSTGGGGGGRAMDSSGGFQFGRAGLDSSRNSAAGGGRAMDSSGGFQFGRNAQLDSSRNGGGRTMISSGSFQFGRQLDTSRNGVGGSHLMDSSGGFQFGRNGGGAGGSSHAMDSSGGYQFGRGGQADFNRNDTSSAAGTFRTGVSIIGGSQFGRSVSDNAATEKRAAAAAASIDRPAGSNNVAQAAPVLLANSASNNSPFGSIDFSTLQRQQVVAATVPSKAPSPPRNNVRAEEAARQAAVFRAQKETLPTAAASPPPKQETVGVNEGPAPSTSSTEVTKASEEAALQQGVPSSNALPTATTAAHDSSNSSSLTSQEVSPDEFLDASQSKSREPLGLVIEIPSPEVVAPVSDTSREEDASALVPAPSEASTATTEEVAISARDESNGGGVDDAPSSSLTSGLSTEAPVAATEAQWRSLFTEELARTGTSTLDKPSFVAVAAAALAIGQSERSAVLASAHDLDAAFTLADEDQSGNVDEEEFVALMKLVEAGLVEGLGGSLFNPFNWGKEEKFKAATTKPAP